MTVVRGYKTTVSDMWGGGDASKLDKVASNAVLGGTGKARDIHRPLHVLRFRFLETMTKDKLHTQNPTKHPDKTCDLCTQTGSWYHIHGINVRARIQTLMNTTQSDITQRGRNSLKESGTGS